MIQEQVVFVDKTAVNNAKTLQHFNAFILNISNNQISPIKLFYQLVLLLVTIASTSIIKIQ
jgi:hypothetical protein